MRKNSETDIPELLEELEDWRVITDSAEKTTRYLRDRARERVTEILILLFTPQPNDRKQRFL